ATGSGWGAGLGRRRRRLGDGARRGARRGARARRGWGLAVAPDEGERARAGDRRVAGRVLDDELVLPGLAQRDRGVGRLDACDHRGPAGIVGRAAAARPPEPPAAGLRVAGAGEAWHLLPALAGAEGAPGAEDA